MELIDYIKSGVIYRSHQLLDPVLIPLYRRTIEGKVKRMRKKQTISVVFVVPELGVWKTESLYREMLAHKRFSPLLLIVPSTEVPENADVVEAYFKAKNYDYVDMLRVHGGIWKVCRPDIIFYQKPYDYSLPNQYNFRHNPFSLFCYLGYGYHTINLRGVLETPLLDACWQVYYENEPCRKGVEDIMRHPCGNGVVTGLSMSDDFLHSKQEYLDPWKQMDDGVKRKRVIWAPHHSIGDADHHGIDYSTFLSYADFMLEMARKYVDKVQFAFKPHPLLKANLAQCWSQEQIESYYHQWESMPNTQLELGAYQGLFMHSDALIHDCGSFTVEYHYTLCPVMYLMKDGVRHDENLSDFGAEAFRIHEKGYSCTDIEQFLVDVIECKDPHKAVRQQFYEEFLLPPNGRTASENIIDAILHG